MERQAYTFVQMGGNLSYEAESQANDLGIKESFDFGFRILDFGLKKI